MRVEVTIDKTKQLPAGAIETFRAEFQKRLEWNYPGAMFSVRQAGSDGCDVMLQMTIFIHGIALYSLAP
ncbi:DinI-like family protein [Rahnella aceris]|uniref:DinI-like family protein n=1 Tax=Rahnella sp. (strain Y9602) TaxID=2703885 RepID=UPI003BA15786